MISVADVSSLSRLMAELRGRSLTSVEFVLDYIQFRFEGSCLTTLILPSVSVNGHTLQAGSTGYYDQVCSLIGQQVLGVEVATEELVVLFSGSACLSVSLKDENYPGPEALNYSSTDGRWAVV